MRYEYPAKIRRGKSVYVIEFTDVPEARVEAPTVRAAEKKAIKALTDQLVEYAQARLPIPRPSPFTEDQFAVPVSLLLAAKLSLYQALNRSRLTKNALAKKLGVTEAIVRRLLDPGHASRIDRIQAALAVLGECVVLEDNVGRSNQSTSAPTKRVCF
jgi:antitoxin HicB